MAMEDVTRYMDAIDKAGQGGGILVCRYCGTRNRSAYDHAICIRCEQFVDSTMNMLEAKDPSLLKSLENIDAALDNRDYESAIKEYDPIFSQRKDPGFLYAEALIYIAYSNYETSLIDYDKEGYMEENSVHRLDSIRLMSQAKLLLNKTVYALNSNAGEGDTPNKRYLTFLSQVKLGQLRGAMMNFSALDKPESNELHSYAGMVFHSANDDIDKALELSTTMIKSGKNVLNAAYYYAFCLFRKNKLKDSARILNRLRQYLDNPNIGELAKKLGII